MAKPVFVSAFIHNRIMVPRFTGQRPHFYVHGLDMSSKEMIAARPLQRGKLPAQLCHLISLGPTIGVFGRKLIEILDACPRHVFPPQLALM